MDTKGNGGKPLKKNVVVVTNDPKNPSINLIVEGVVDKLVTISPKLVRLTGPMGEAVSSEVLIVPEKKYSFKVLEALPEKEGNIELTFREMVAQDGTLAYKLHVVNKTNAKGKYENKVILTTTSKYQPTISVPVVGNIN